MIFEAEREAGVPVEWSQAWLRVCGFLEQAKWRPAGPLRGHKPLLCPDIISRPTLTLQYWAQIAVTFVLHSETLPPSVACEEAPMLVSIAVGVKRGGLWYRPWRQQRTFVQVSSVRPSIHSSTHHHPPIHPFIHASSQPPTDPTPPSTGCLKCLLTSIMCLSHILGTE